MAKLLSCMLLGFLAASANCAPVEEPELEARQYGKPVYATTSMSNGGMGGGMMTNGMGGGMMTNGMGGGMMSMTTTPTSANKDVSVLNYALTLENLEATFYVQALQNFTKDQFLAAGLSERDYNVITEVRDHEVTHVNFLKTAISAIGATPVPACTYNFPDTDVKSFLAIARALEKTGVSAYIGAAPMISNPAYLTAAASIVTVEARHTAFFNYITGKAPIPQAFDIPLGMRSVVSIAAPFIVSCPYTLPMVFPALSISPATPAAGSQLTVTYNGSGAADSCVFLAGAGNKVAPISNGSCTVPAGLVGDIYVVIAKVSDAAMLSDDNTVAGPASFTTPDKADIA